VSNNIISKVVVMVLLLDVMVVVKMAKQSNQGSKLNSCHLAVGTSLFFLINKLFLLDSSQR